jgi:arylsulfatase A-like enzyme
MDANAVTLATLLKEAGYATGAVLGGPWMKRVFKLDRGFEHYDDESITSVNGRRAESITTAALKWIEALSGNRFFLFLNYFDVHHPFNAPGKYATAFSPAEPVPGKRPDRMEAYRAGYDCELLYMDHHIGQLLSKLKDLKLYDDTWIIVTADHGDLLGEHGRTGHGKSLTQQELHVPLFMKYPRGEVPPGKSDDPVQLIDILPLICDHRGLPVPDGIQGNLPSKVTHPIFAETYPLKSVTKKGHWRAIFDDNFKFVWNSLGNHQLFDLAEDPAENHNLFGKEPKRDQQLLAKLDSYMDRMPKPGKSDFVQGVDDETIQAIKNVGYLK